MEHVLPDIQEFRQRVKKWKAPQEGRAHFKHQTLSLLRSLDRYERAFGGGPAPLKKLHSPHELIVKVDEFRENDDIRFYIGFTNRKDYFPYLRETRPKGQEWEFKAHYEGRPFKVQTYFIYLNGRACEDDFIPRWKADHRCLNNASGRKDLFGMVYVVLYNYYHEYEWLPGRCLKEEGPVGYGCDRDQKVQMPVGDGLGYDQGGLAAGTGRTPAVLRVFPKESAPSPVGSDRVNPQPSLCHDDYQDSDEDLDSWEPQFVQIAPDTDIGTDTESSPLTEL